MSLHYIIDGYNVVKKTPFLKNKKLKDARDGLMRFIENHRPQGSSANKITVVFDGREDVFDFGNEYASSVVFTKGITADDYIKSFVDESRDKKNIVVVSEDKEIIFYCRPQGAKILSVDEFMKKANKIERSRKAHQKDPIELTVREITEINEELSKIWLK